MLERCKAAYVHHFDGCLVFLLVCVLCILQNVLKKIDGFNFVDFSFFFFFFFEVESFVELKEKLYVWEWVCPYTVVSANLAYVFAHIWIYQLMDNVTSSYEFSSSFLHRGRSFCSAVEELSMCFDLVFLIWYKSCNP